MEKRHRKMADQKNMFSIQVFFGEDAAVLGYFEERIRT
jgi:hypothetical protein